MVCGATIKILSPGATGMKSNIDVDLLKPTDSRYAENVDITSEPGVNRRRKGQKRLGDNSQTVYGAYGYSNLEKSYKQIIGISAESVSVNVGIDTTASPDTSLYYAIPASVMRNIWVTDDNSSGLQDSSLDISFVGVGDYYDFTNMLGNVIVTGYKSIPFVYVPDRGSPDSADFHTVDTLYFRPHVISLGLEAPGQLRVGVLNESGNPDGDYRYSYKYQSIAGSFIYWSALPSRVVSPNSQRVYLTLFEGEGNTAYTGDTIIIEILRQKVGYPWYQIGNMVFLSDSNIFYIDSLADNTGTLVPPPFVDGNNNLRFDKLGNNAVMPGGLMVGKFTTGAQNYETGIYDTSLVDSGPAKEPDRTASDSTSWLAYSYYDPITGLESPLGPIVVATGINKLGYRDTTFGDSGFYLGYSKGYTKEFERPSWIRVYRTTKDDSTIFYGLFQVRANYCYPDDTTHYQYTVFPGHVADSQLTTGMFMWLFDSLQKYYYNDIIIAEDGASLVRPPFVTQLEIPLTDLEYANGRLWGIGDPLYTSRLYYSNYDSMGEWSPLDYLSLNEGDGDELVALEKLPYGDNEILYAIKHNSIYSVRGYDIDWDVTLVFETGKMGTINRNTIIKADDEILFLSPNMKIYSLTRGEPKEISQPIENWIDSIFGDYAEANTNVYTFRLSDKVCWIDTADSKVLAYNLISRTWSIETYTFQPVGWFRHDTSETKYGLGDYDYWLYEYDAVNFIIENTTQYDVVGASVLPNFKVELPTTFDAENLWSIDEVNMTAFIEGSATVTIRVIGDSEDTLATVTLTGDARVNKSYSFGFGANVSRRPILQITIGNTAAGFKLYDLNVKTRIIGRATVQ